jgi:hypothetical protein
VKVFINIVNLVYKTEVYRNIWDSIHTLRTTRCRIFLYLAFRRFWFNQREARRLENWVSPEHLLQNSLRQKSVRDMIADEWFRARVHQNALHADAFSVSVGASSQFFIYESYRDRAIKALRLALPPSPALVGRLNLTAPTRIVPEIKVVGMDVTDISHIGNFAYVTAQRRTHNQALAGGLANVQTFRSQRSLDNLPSAFNIFGSAAPINPAAPQPAPAPAPEKQTLKMMTKAQS